MQTVNVNVPRPNRAWSTLLFSVMRWLALLQGKGQYYATHCLYQGLWHSVHSLCITKLVMYGLDEWTIMWVGNWLDCWPQRVVISGANFSWQPVNSDIHQGWMLGPTLFSVSINIVGSSVLSASLQMTPNTLLFREILDNLEEQAVSKNFNFL